MIATIMWLSLSPETRLKIATVMSIQRSGGSEVVDGRVVSDGYTPLDLSVVTLERLQDFLGSKSDNFGKLWQELIERLETPMVDITDEIVEPEKPKTEPKAEKPKAEKPKAEPKKK